MVAEANIPDSFYCNFVAPEEEKEAKEMVDGGVEDNAGDGERHDSKHDVSAK